MAVSMIASVDPVAISESKAKTATATVTPALSEGEETPPGEKPDSKLKFHGFPSPPDVHAHSKDSLGGGTLRFNTAKHAYLGDNIDLYKTDGKTQKAATKQLALSNTLCLTYGQINALAGDFYGSDLPISDAPNLEQQQARFKQAFDCLVKDTSRQPDEANNLITILDNEIELIQKAADDHEDSSTAYTELPDTDLELELATVSCDSPELGYAGISLVNWDHFGGNAHVSYVAGHSVALQKAYDGDLDMGYAYNAFADHFLEDSFSSGHICTPRKKLHHLVFDKEPNVRYDFCADVPATPDTNSARACQEQNRDSEDMHDEDSHLGIQVENKSESTWTMYGDESRDICRAAVQQSVREVYEAYEAGKTKGPLLKPEYYGFWERIPDIDAAMTDNDLVPLFKLDRDDCSTLMRHKDIFSWCEREYTPDWTAWGTHETIAWASEKDCH